MIAVLKDSSQVRLCKEDTHMICTSVP